MSSSSASRMVTKKKCSGIVSTGSKSSSKTRSQNEGKSKGVKVSQPPFPLYDDYGDQGENKTFERGIESIVSLLKGRKNVVVLVGAGISVSCGIPDFRSKGTGIYHNMDANELGLSTPEELFHLEVFQDDPRPFYRFAKEKLYPIAEIEPSASHHFLSMLEKQKMLLRVYTQNIDGLEEKCGISPKKVVYAHGSLNTSTCLTCGAKVSADELREEILSGNIPYCRRVLASRKKRKRDHEVVPVVPNKPTRIRRSRTSDSNNPNIDLKTESFTNDKIRTCDGVMKPNITFFGERLVDQVTRCLEADRKKADACIVIGTSLSVAPMSRIIEYLSPAIPRILINRAVVVPKHQYGDSDKIVSNCKKGNNAKNIQIGDKGDEINKNEKDHRSGFLFDACLLGFCDEVTKTLMDAMNNKTSKKMVRKRSPVKKEEPEYNILCNLQNETSINDRLLHNHPHDRIFLFPGASIHKENDERVNDEDSSSDNVQCKEVVHCDECHNVIENGVMKCIDCFDYDLCGKCFVVASRDHFDGNHKFIAE
mmetsp:Transcript_2878/g.3262  ORF Transcript_2878/g.3262 Transcript_2878/m.3262 type:complete len:536 (+) Transcript_2878:104-1711(+)